MKLRALIFDDDEQLRALLWSIFDQRGYEVLTYPAPGLCPLKTAGECPCPPDTVCADVIITDIQMPDANGIDFIEQLFEKKCRRPHTAIMSGTWSDAQMDRAERLGCMVFQKPFRMTEVVEWLEQVEKVISPDRRLFDWQH